MWCAIVGLAGEPVAWMQLLAFADHDARRWEPKRLRYRVFSVAAELTRTGRQTLLHLASGAPWAELVTQGIGRMRALTAPD